MEDNKKLVGVFLTYWVIIVLTAMGVASLFDTPPTSLGFLVGAVPVGAVGAAALTGKHR